MRLKLLSRQKIEIGIPIRLQTSNFRFNSINQRSSNTLHKLFNVNPKIQLKIKCFEDALNIQSQNSTCILDFPKILTHNLHSEGFRTV